MFRVFFCHDPLTPWHLWWSLRLLATRLVYYSCPIKILDHYPPRIYKDKRNGILKHRLYTTLQLARHTDTEKDILILQSFWFIKPNFHPFFFAKLDMRNINLNINERPKRTASRKVRRVSFKKHINPNKTAEQPSLVTKLSSK